MKVNLWKVASAIASWFFWAVRNILILPAGMFLLLICLIFIHDKTTPGQLIVGIIKNADAVTDGIQWKWRECQIPRNAPDIDGTDDKKAPPYTPPSIRATECSEVVSDSAGYASYIDRSMISVLGMLWAVLAFLCTGMSCLLRNYPHTAFPRTCHSKAVL
ncbi:TPA: hypothetical protein QIR73_002085 [Enterobacter cloacae]|nr:hypothetical protein [Enterobacter cloacae]